ncbi:hypothetical protein [Kosakonia sp. WA-90]|uniref:hypothetical protein n=1 Tax=Kosakonia sp. WA-90 TaxID=3153576 RepID=UPI00325ED095
MARRRELQGIANALTGSFVSRNNDFKGYWSIGQLKSLAINNGLTSITFSLSTLKISTVCDLLSFITHHYADMLESLLIKQQVPERWVKEASITIDFNADAEHIQLHECLTAGEPFQCSCQIIDDNFRNYSSIIYGLCAPHSAAKELKSTRKFTL